MGEGQDRCRDISCFKQEQRCSVIFFNQNLSKSTSCYVACSTVGLGNEPTLSSSPIHSTGQVTPLTAQQSLDQGAAKVLDWPTPGHVRPASDSGTRHVWAGTFASIFSKSRDVETACEIWDCPGQFGTYGHPVHAAPLWDLPCAIDPGLVWIGPIGILSVELV